MRYGLFNSFKAVCYITIFIEAYLKYVPLTKNVWISKYLNLIIFKDVFLQLFILIIMQK